MSYLRFSNKSLSHRFFMQVHSFLIPSQQIFPLLYCLFAFTILLGERGGAEFRFNNNIIVHRK